MSRKTRFPGKSDDSADILKGGEPELDRSLETREP